MVQAFIFDVDGVLVDSPHERAWGDTLRNLLENEWLRLKISTGYRHERYTNALYQRVVAGKPRMDGARALLTAFGLPDDDEHTQLLAHRKQMMIVDLIRQGAFRAFDDGISFLLKARAAGFKTAAASSSKNAKAMMAKVFLAPHGIPKELELDPNATLLDVLDTNVSGRGIQPGKPHPKLFLTAAKEINIAPANCLVVEDAPVGVIAAKSGGMKCIGVARHDDAQGLRDVQADWVVSSLDEIQLSEVTQ